MEAGGGGGRKGQKYAGSWSPEPTSLKRSIRLASSFLVCSFDNKSSHWRTLGDLTKPSKSSNIVISVPITVATG